MNTPPTQIESARDFARALLSALDVDITQVVSFDLHCEAGEVPTLSLVRLLPKGSGEAAARVAERYRLEPVSAQPMADVDESVSMDLATRTTHRPAG